MPEYSITYRYKYPETETIPADSEEEAIKKLRENHRCIGDPLEIIEIKELKTYMVEFEYRSYQSKLVGAYSEEHVREFFGELAEHDPDGYTRNPDVIITRITEVTENQEDEE